jgi:hypothetical protein
MGLSCPAKRSRSSVAAIRFAAPALPFRRPRGVSGIRRPMPKHRKLPWTWTSLQGSPNQPRRGLSAPTTLLGFLRPYSDVSVEVHGPGFPDPVRSAFRVSHPLDGFLPPAPPGPERPVPLMGFTLQSFSPSRSRTPFGADALLPFLASRSPALRTRRPRCPAAPGRCSPRRSVPDSAEADRADALLGFSPLQSVPRTPWSRLPDSFLPALSAAALEEDGGAALQGLPERAGRGLPRGNTRLS